MQIGPSNAPTALADLLESASAAAATAAAALTCAARAAPKALVVRVRRAMRRPKSTLARPTHDRYAPMAARASSGGRLWQRRRRAQVDRRRKERSLGSARLGERRALTRAASQPCCCCPRDARIQLPARNKWLVCDRRNRRRRRRCHLLLVSSLAPLLSAQRKAPKHSNAQTAPTGAQKSQTRLHTINPNTTRLLPDRCGGHLHAHLFTARAVRRI